MSAGASIAHEQWLLRARARTHARYPVPGVCCDHWWSMRAMVPGAWLASSGRPARCHARATPRRSPLHGGDRLLELLLQREQLRGLRCEGELRFEGSCTQHKNINSAHYPLTQARLELDRDKKTEVQHDFLYSARKLFK